jgi:hypothetical protein
MLGDWCSVTGATRTPFRVLGVPAAGKTGTELRPIQAICFVDMKEGDVQT